MKMVRKSLEELVLVLSVSASATLLGAVPATATTLITPAGTSFVVNNTSSQDSSDPHVDGDLVSYSNSNTDGTNFTVRYKNLASGVDTGIPLASSGEFNFLSDVNAGRIVFTQVTAPAAEIALYDTTASPATRTVLDPHQGLIRQTPNIGGTNVVWQEFTSSTSSDIVAYNLSSKTTTPLANNGNVALNEAPAISRDGNVVAWDSCAQGHCDIYDAISSGGTWTAHQLTNNNGDCRHPDTNGITVVYSCNRGAGDQAYYQPAAGGTERTINWGGQATYPAIAGNYVSFAALPSGAATHQIYVAELSGGPTQIWNGNLYLLQNPPNMVGDAQLNDITVNPATGLVTVVWQVQHANVAVYGFSWIPATSDLDLSLSIAPAAATTGQTAVASASLTNTATVRRTVTLQVTFSYTDPSGSTVTRSYLTFSFTLRAGKTVHAGPFPFQIADDMPRGTYQVTVTASDVTGAVTRTATLTVV